MYKHTYIKQVSKNKLSRLNGVKNNLILTRMLLKKGLLSYQLTDNTHYFMLLLTTRMIQCWEK